MYIIFAQISFTLAWSGLQIPVTGQSFAILLWAYIFGWKYGVISVLLYIVLGMAGLPVFADGKSGVEVLTGNSGGFVAGFVFASLLTGLLSDRLRNNIENAFIATFAGTVIILLIGILRLNWTFGFEKALAYGFLPFWPGALIKIVAGSFSGYYLKKLTIKKTAPNEAV